MKESFAGRVAVVTGASSGIGRALAVRLAARGAKVGLVARRRDALSAVADEIRVAGGVAVVAPADVEGRDEVAAAVAAVRALVGPVDLLVANAGVGVPTRLDPVNVDDVERMVRVNVLGVVYSVAAVLPDMLARRAGHLAAVSSLAGYVGLPGESGYCATKAAVSVYFDGLRAHLRGRGVRVTTLCPGFVKTPMTEADPYPKPGMLTADDAARRMVRAMERGAAVYDFPFTTKWLVRLARRLPDGVLARAMGGGA